MKTTRRQDLKTNELSQQIEQFRAYAKEHVGRLIAIGVVIVAAAAASYWYFHVREQRLMDGWTTLSGTEVLADGEASITVFESLAKEDLDPALTAEALLKVGDVAMGKITGPDASVDGPADPGAVDATHWNEKARTAYGEVVTRFRGNWTASGKAMLRLAVLAENQSDADTARSWYREIMEDERFAATLFHERASYRLANLDRWSTTVSFQQPVHTVPEPQDARPLGRPTSPSFPTSPRFLTSPNKPVPVRPPASESTADRANAKPAAETTPKPGPPETPGATQTDSGQTAPAGGEPVEKAAPPKPGTATTPPAEG